VLAISDAGSDLSFAKNIPDASPDESVDLGRMDSEANNVKRTSTVPRTRADSVSRRHNQQCIDEDADSVGMYSASEIGMKCGQSDTEWINEYTAQKAKGTPRCLAHPH
jgi:hypothetical protein